MLTIVASFVPLDPVFKSVLEKLAIDHESGSWSFTVAICTVPKQLAIDVAVEELAELPSVRDAITQLQSMPVVSIDGLIRLDRHGRYRCCTFDTDGHFSALKSVINNCLNGVFESLIREDDEDLEDTDLPSVLIRHTMLSDQQMLVELEEYHNGARQDTGEVHLQMSTQLFTLECIDIINSATLTQAAA